jgi:hypothetical protein
MGLIYAISLGHDSLRKAASPDRRDIGVREFSVPVVKPVVMPAFLGRVGIVFSDGPEPQVRRLDANRVVALVHYDHSARDRSDQFLVDVPMGIGSASGFTSSGCDDPVSKCTSVASPKPACAHALNARFKRDRREDVFVIIETAFSALLHVAQLAKVAAERFAFAKKAFLFTLFHSSLVRNERVMSLP